MVSEKEEKNTPEKSKPRDSGIGHDSFSSDAQVAQSAQVQENDFDDERFYDEDENNVTLMLTPAGSESELNATIREESEGSASEDEDTMVNEADRRILVNQALSKLKPLDLTATSVEEEIEKYEYNFKEVLKTHLTAAEIAGIDPGQRTALWRWHLGDAAREVLRKATWAADEDENNIEHIKTKILKSSTTGANNERVAFGKFWERHQRKGESVESWLRELESLAKTAKMDEKEKERNIIQVIAKGHRSKETRKAVRAKATKNEQYKDIRDFIILEEQVEEEDEAMERQHESPKKQFVNESTRKPGDRPHAHGSDKKPWKQGNEKPWNRKNRGCRYCGNHVSCRYAQVRCSAYGHKCLNCGQWNHYEWVCEQDPNPHRGKIPAKHQQQQQQKKDDKRSKKKRHRADDVK